ncbi:MULTISPECIES: hypothetical protein [Frankia]|uniref:hypothetical protein n=1 Tax=Frankia TaxID=1854 RepID=UPI0010417F8F|nr:MULTISPECIES: hypothetical protein [Frankia]
MVADLRRVVDAQAYASERCFLSQVRLARGVRGARRRSTRCVFRERLAAGGERDLVGPDRPLVGGDGYPGAVDDCQWLGGVA